MVSLLVEKMDFTQEEAYMMVSLVGGAYICQACEGRINSTVRVVIPKILKNLTKGALPNE